MCENVYVYEFVCMCVSECLNVWVSVCMNVSEYVYE